MPKVRRPGPAVPSCGELGAQASCFLASDSTEMRLDQAHREMTELDRRGPHHSLDRILSHPSRLVLSPAIRRRHHNRESRAHSLLRQEGGIHIGFFFSKAAVHLEGEFRPGSAVICHVGVTSLKGSSTESSRRIGAVVVRSPGSPSQSGSNGYLIIPLPPSTSGLSYTYIPATTTTHGDPHSPVQYEPT